MSNLFAVVDIDDENKKQTSTNWLTIGSSYDEINRKKKQTATEKSSQNIPKEDRSFFNVGQRKTAADLISSEESDTAEIEIKKQKKKKRRHKKEKAYSKVTQFNRIDE